MIPVADTIEILEAEAKRRELTPVERAILKDARKAQEQGIQQIAHAAYGRRVV